ncbi:MAG: hybrid sensor histidine kinase/response regulator, partial [Candidatus Glassbacteria bacterium RIFCSPLOWO2_12_FULL_58_11]
AAELDSLLRQTEELSFIKLELDQYLGSLKETSESLELWKKQWSQAAPQLKQLFQPADSGSAGTVPGVSGLPEVLENNFEHFKLLETRLAGLEKSVEADRRTVSAMVDTLLAGLKNTLMSPCSSMLEIFPKIVRELSRDQGKQVELQLRGGEVEIDRRIMEQIKEPLIHLVRNSIDHGIEKPELRERLNKPSLGRLTMAINQLKSNQIEILVSDDGAGIDLEKIKKAAVKKGIISEKEARRLTDQEALALIFESNISTSAIITDISGRGLGLTIVREKVEKVSGSVAVETSPNAGTTFRLVLPITLASFRAVLVKVNGQPFAIPTMQVLQSRKINKEEVKTVENRETISANGYTLPLVRLADVLELRERSEEERSGPVSALILGTADKLVAFSVDQLLGEQEILLKSLGSQLSRVRNITGATILGSGQVVPVLNVSDLIKSARQATAAQSEALIPAAEKAKKKSILVVEDSITARMLLKNILESAGYAVKTAVDGLDGFTQLRTADFDLLVSDVDMPRLNGFDLTSKVRGDRKLADLPVVLVTALDSRADRERGIDVGANAYIVKSTFDQSNLLEVIQRLI